MHVWDIHSIGYVNQNSAHGQHQPMQHLWQTSDIGRHWTNYELDFEFLQVLSIRVSHFYVSLTIFFNVAICLWLLIHKVWLTCWSMCNDISISMLLIHSLYQSVSLLQYNTRLHQYLLYVYELVYEIFSLAIRHIGTLIHVHGCLSYVMFRCIKTSSIHQDIHVCSYSHL